VSEEPQPRDKHGHFKSSKHSCNCKKDISLQDIAEAMKTIDGIYSKPVPERTHTSIELERPVTMDLRVAGMEGIDMYHHHDEASPEDIFIKLSIGMLALVASFYLLWRMFFQ
jgi:hypothetical protein